VAACAIYDVERDPKGIAIALAELLEESFASSRVASSFETADEETERRITASLPLRTLSPGYYKLATYLFWLSERVQPRALCGQLAMFEMEGMIAVQQARQEQLVKHPKCSACGALQDGKFAAQCHACHAKFKRDE
jgi:hypothetical protein